jgi:hypothetical protein
MAAISQALAGFFSEDVDAVLAAVTAMESGSEAGRTFGAVTSAETFRRKRGSDRLLFERRGLFSEVTFGPARDFLCACGAVAGEERAGTVCEKCGVECGPASLRGERYGHIEVQQVVHPAAYSAIVQALGWVCMNLHALAIGEIYMRGYRQIHHSQAEDGDVTGPKAIEAALRAVDPQHPLLPLCTIRKIPVPPPEARPFIRDLAPTMIDPWIGPLNQAWIGLVERATREAKLVEVKAPSNILEDEMLAVQRVFEEIIEASKPALPLVPPLVHAPVDLSDDRALGLAFIKNELLVVQRANAIFLITDEGAVVRALPPAGCKLAGVLRDRIAVFQGFFTETYPSFMDDIAPWGNFVSIGEEGMRRPAPHFGEISALDCETGEFLTDVPAGLPRGAVQNDQPEDLFFVDPVTGRSTRLHVGGDRPEALAYTRDMQLCWIGEDTDTQVIELSRGIPHVVPAAAAGVEETLELDNGDNHEDGDDEDYDDYKEGYGCAVTFREGKFHFLWQHGIVADHRGDNAFQIDPEPLAGAFDPSGRRLAVVIGAEIVLIDVDKRAVIRRFPLPSRD